MRILVTFISANTSCDSVQTLLSNICIFSYLWVARGGAVGSGTALQAGRSRVRLRFFIGIVLPAALRPWGRSTESLNGTEYQEYFLVGERRPVRRADDLSSYHWHSPSGHTKALGSIESL